MKVLIGCDGSICSDDAINDLPRAGLPRQASALIVQVQEKWLMSPIGSEIIEDAATTTDSVGAKTARDEAEPQIKIKTESSEITGRATQRLLSYFPEWTTETVSLQGSPAREIIGLANERDVDLIVIGSHGRTENRRVALGSVSQKIANEAACSVRIVRGQAWKKGSPSRLLIGLDGTNGSKAAVAEAARRMWIMGSEVRLVVARDASENKSEWLDDYLEEAKKILERAELAVTELVEAGDPKQIIAASAEEWGADCIFLGANSAESSDENTLLGSVSTAIVTRAHCTVEIVRQKTVTI